MKYLSVCSGIEAATVAWHSLGWKPLAFSEIEPFPRKVLSHHYPDVPLHGDFTLLREQDWIKDADILVGGTPCQAFSVAGLRHSLNDDRGNLTLEFVRLADAIDAIRSIPCTIVWENVPGVLSVKDNAFGCFLGALAGESLPLVATGGRWANAGFVDGPKRTIAWRILDAQYFGVAQRRRRLFVVASARTDIDPAEILFEFEGLRRDTPPSREQGQEVAATIAARFGISRNNHEEVVSQYTEEVSPTLTKEGTGVSRPGFQEDGWYVAVAGSLDTQCGGSKLTHQSVANGHIVAARMVAFGEYVDDGTASAMKARDYKDATDLVAQPITQFGEIAGTLSARYDSSPCADRGQNMVAQPIAFHVDTMPDQMNFSSETTASLTVSQHAGVVQSMAVRRLTPRECERLQGFPDDYTAIPGAADGPRYKALGNSMAVPVMAWIGKRIANALD
jgi:DNA (cytosine-5)-methyltransferase 1